MLNKIKNKESGIIFLIAILQIILLTIMIPAESYTIHQTDSSFKDLKINDGKDKEIKKIFDFGINLIVGFLSIKEIGFVSAEEEIEAYCCPDTCDDVPSTYEGCSVELIPSPCEQTDCRKGCCIDESVGTCSTSSPKGKCASPGRWDPDATCNNVNDCRNGCCIIGSTRIFKPRVYCVKISAGRDFIFNPQIGEPECILTTSTSEAEGACVVGTTCTFEIENECSGSFYEGIFCSDDRLKEEGVNCDEKAHKRCVEGKYDVYWFDSCGNREGIANGAGENGKCNFPSSSCSEEDGEAECKEMGCKGLDVSLEGNGGGQTERANGEKWCLYDGYIGDGRDTVGSEHWLASCINGEVEIEQCGNGYRSYLCQQQVIEEEGKTFTEASCVPNKDTVCQEITQDYFDSEMAADDLEEMLKDCDEEKHCMIKNVNIAEYFKFSTCVPRYPKGDNLRDEEDGNMCYIANRECPVVYEKGFLGWECKNNCQCESSEFAKQMNDFCISIGDCGGKVNYEDGGTDNVKIKGKKGHKIGTEGNQLDAESEGSGNAPAKYGINYDGDGTITERQFVNLSSGSLDSILGSSYTPAALLNFVEFIPGAAGAAIAGAVFFSKEVLFVNWAQVGMDVGWTTATEAGFLTIFACAFIGMSLAGFLGRILNRSPSAIALFMISGVIAGTGVGVAIVFANAIGTTSWVPALGWIIAVVGLFAIFLLSIFGIGERETRRVSFKCQPWVAPRGGSEETCDKCNKDPLRRCSEYRCNALGQMCELKNKGTEHPICISLKLRNQAPDISLGEVKTEGYKFGDETSADNGGTIVNIEDTAGGEACIQEGNDIWFTLKTDIPTQCLYSFERPPMEYDEMEGEEPVEETLYTKTHTFNIEMPSLGNENVYDVTGIEPDQQGQLRMYVKCADGQEPPKFNIVDYIVHFCITSEPDIEVVNFNRIWAEPESGTTLKYGTPEQLVTIWTNEKVEECRYSTAAETNYEDMTDSFTLNSPYEKDIRGWPSSATLSLGSGINNFYIKCKDISGNINLDDFEYTLKVSETELKIDSITINYGIKKINDGESIIVEIQPVSVDMEVKTSGGFDDGKSICKWGWREGETPSLTMSSDWFATTKIHTQPTSVAEGTHARYFECTDDAGNKAAGEIGFAIDIDDEPPKVIRALKEGQNLKIVTDELAKCYYSLNTCGFNLEDGTSMTSVPSTIHKTVWKAGNIYHIKCKDVYGIENPDCAIKIIPSI